MAYSIAIQQGSNVSVWASYLVSAIMQGILLVMCVWYTVQNRHVESILEETDGSTYNCIREGSGFEEMHRAIESEISINK